MDADLSPRTRDRNAEGRPENARPRNRFGAPLPRGAEDELADREEPEEVVSGVEDALERAVALFDEERFFEAHEFLEWVWKSDDVAPDDRDFWKGITQVAVGFCHAQRGNAKGAATLLERANRYLAPYPATYHGVDARRLAGDAVRVAQLVRQQGASPAIDFPRFPRD